jgi:hypothetical protein
MSLPGLDLSEVAAEASYAPPPPAEVNLKPGSEWRFEIAFGASVRVKVSLSSVLVSFLVYLTASLLRSRYSEHSEA